MNEPLKLLAIESEEIYSYLYELLARNNSFELLGVLNDIDAVPVKESHPDVILVGMKRFEAGIIEKLTELYSGKNKVGLVVLFNSYNNDDIQMVKRLAPEWHGGIAFFLRQSIGQTDQLVNIISSVAQGQISLDPSLAHLMFGGKSSKSFLHQLTPRELEVLNLLASGHTNIGIADNLYIDVKTVEHHLNSMYSKIKAESICDNKHPRVAAALMYLEEVGALSKAS
ncbi:MAG: response regulator transcription factor [Dehalococcoidales bacterium]|nr:response regulator transcription factor [Dehalococcoidales bacterium]